MSSPIPPTTAPVGASTVVPSASGDAADIGAIVAELAAGDSTLALEASRGGPPLELLEQIAAAGATEERLRERGQQLRFCSAPGERTRIELHDDAGGSVRTLSITEALEIVAGKPIE
jgi:hypothetical protein